MVKPPENFYRTFYRPSTHTHTHIITSRLVVYYIRSFSGVRFVHYTFTVYNNIITPRVNDRNRNFYIISAIYMIFIWHYCNILHAPVTLRKIRRAKRRLKCTSFTLHTAVYINNIYLRLQVVTTTHVLRTYFEIIIIERSHNRVFMIFFYKDRRFMTCSSAVSRKSIVRLIRLYSIFIYYKTIL